MLYAQANKSMGMLSTASALNGETDAVQAGLSEAGTPSPVNNRDPVHVCQTPELEH
ncbi:hypothetical protein P7K49_014078 [Saguinus oedipus]|uniref:Uncharacterized protein n=1 Tax=Saguinus oedipus TaxID=9490 RepID=A0ABQ9VHU4_SAGOE|nr:hypothetical protein P7K49_014078 [Saguinus oedipus]